MRIRQAFLLAGGKGERLRPLTDTIPKPLVQVVNKPILQYNIELLSSYGVREIILATGYLHEKIEHYFGDGSKFGVKIIHSVEREPLGTGGALKLCEKNLDETFIMGNGDNIADFDFKKMLRFHIQKKAQATLQLVAVDDVTGFGVAKMDGHKIIEFVEKPSGQAPSNLVNAGAYIIEKDALGLIPEGFSLIERTMFPALAAGGKLFGFEHKGYWLTTDTFERLEAAKKALLSQKMI